MSSDKKETLVEKIITAILAFSIVAVALYFDITAPL